MDNQRNVDKFLRLPYRGISLLLALLAMGVLASPVMAQRPLDPLTPREIELAKSVLLGDRRANQYLGGNSRYHFVNIERHEEDKSVAGTAERRADVVLYNYTKDETVSAVVRVGTSPRVDAMQIIRDRSPGLSPEEVEEAKQLALADPGVQMKLTAAGISEIANGSLIITYLFAQASDKADACSTHRCVLLYFNTREVALLSVVVDLSARRVHVE